MFLTQMINIATRYFCAIFGDIFSQEQNWQPGSHWCLQPRAELTLSASRRKPDEQTSPQGLQTSLPTRGFKVFLFNRLERKYWKNILQHTNIHIWSCSRWNHLNWYFVVCQAYQSKYTNTKIFCSLANCRIETVAAECFHGLSSLQRLSLAGNLLTVLAPHLRFVLM